MSQKGATFKVYDPISYKEAKMRLENISDRITYCSNEYETMEESDALVIITEWNQFRNLDLERVRSLLKQPYFFDFRNIYRRDVMEDKGFKYYGVGQGVLAKRVHEAQILEEAATTVESLS